MQIVGPWPEDAPDPRLESIARARAFPADVVGLTPQPAITDTGGYGFQEHKGANGRTSAAVSISYTFLSNPSDRSDPANLADIDERTRASLDAEPRWPRPAWMKDFVELMRYPLLWEAVRTSWDGEHSERSSLAHQLVDHANHVLRNRYRDELGLRRGPDQDRGWEAATTAVRAGATARVDGREIDAVELDTDPFVYGIGFRLNDHVVVTAVLPRDKLPYIHAEFASNALPAAT